MTSGRANSACALTAARRSIACTDGHTTGPPAENAYAVDPVGVAQTMPSPPQRDSGRPSTSTTTSSMRSRDAFSTVTSLSAQSRADLDAVADDDRRRGSSALRRRTSRPGFVQRSSRDRTGRPRRGSPTWPRLTPSSGTPAGRASSAARNSVPSPPSATTSSTPSQRGTRRDDGDVVATQASGLGRPARSTATPAAIEPVGQLAGRADRGAPAGVDDEQDARVWLIGGPAGDGSIDRGVVDGRRAAAQPEEVLHVARRTRQRARGHPAHAEPERPGGGGDPAYGVRAGVRVADDAAGADRLAAHLELRLDHQQQVPVRRGAAGQRRQDQRERDERQVGDGQVDRAADALGRGARGRSCARGPARADRCAAARRAARSPRRPRRPRCAPARSSTSVNPPVERRRPDSAGPRPAARQDRVERAGELAPRRGRRSPGRRRR